MSTVRGEVLGYVKIGWNDLTRRLVDDEARALERFDGVGTRGFHVPQAAASRSAGGPRGHRRVTSASRDVAPSCPERRAGSERGS